MSTNIAIDGPAGAGKSTVARAVAKELSYIYVDTGAMYRAMAVHLLHKGTDLENAAAVAQSCQDAEITIAYENGEQQVFLGEENVTLQLRTEEVGKAASKSSPNPAVRQKLFHLQRELAAKYDVVMDGRDIGTTILPEADVKIYLTASVSTRALRRYKELLEKGEHCELAQIEKDIEERDFRDKNREISPLRQAKDAVLVDSSEMTAAEVIRRILEICKEKDGR